MPNHRHPSRYGVPFTGLPLFEEAIFGIYISPESCEDISWLRRRSDKKLRTSYPDSNSTANAAGIPDKEPNKPMEAESDTSSATTSSSEDDLIPNRAPHVAIAPVKGSTSAQTRKNQFAASAPVAPLPQSTSRITRRRSSQDSSNPVRRISLSQPAGQLSTNLTSLRMSQPISQSQPSTRRLSIHRHFSLSKDKPVLERPLEDTSSATDSSDESEDPIATMSREDRPRSSQQSICSAKSDLRDAPHPTEPLPMDVPPMGEDELCSELTKSDQPKDDADLSISAEDVQMKDDGISTPLELTKTGISDITTPVKGGILAKNDNKLDLHESDTTKGSSDSPSFSASGIADVSTTLVEDESKAILCALEIHPKESASPMKGSVVSDTKNIKEDPELQSPGLQDNKVELSSLQSSPPSQTPRKYDIKPPAQTPDLRIKPEDQSPWMEEPDRPVVEETNQERGASGSEGTVARATPDLLETREEQSQSIIIPEEAQSPWTKDPSQRVEVNNAVVEHSSPQLPETAPRDVQVEAASDPVENAPNPPSDVSNANFSIRSFSSFMTPPAKPRFANVPGFDGRLPQTPILLDAALDNPWQSNSHPKKKRVSWAPLPHEETPDARESNPPPSSHSRFSRASPPPAEPIPDEVEGDGEAFRKHFVLVKRRADPLRQRLLPSASQQTQRSPQTDAMAQAFLTADHVVPQAGQLKGDKENVEQEPVDDVDAVLGNLNEFLDTWDLDADLERSRTSLGSHDAGAAANRMLLDPEIGGW
ncbi:hypothetical protein SAPIO_CDS1121 [Scedosporium apiospermum]|uniref:Protamine P1 n=1 Tax=Pseudallescheria apiosperma TaxID=563466 RepID=A0A084GFW9_PSEDA|nr:uncharacterized protein SAPIO_CDS1121 [Scedosporium apiospermum]KEZ46231.1 hypothetical protein SAPIO_CDS1121 [Scedosporium apiospermum]